MYRGMLTITYYYWQRVFVSTIGHQDCVLCIAYSPRGDMLVTGSKDKSVQVWESHSGNALHVDKGNIFAHIS